MKILITGITGFIGSELARKLVSQKEYELAGIVRATADKDHIPSLNAPPP